MRSGIVSEFADAGREQQKSVRQYPQKFLRAQNDSPPMAGLPCSHQCRWAFAAGESRLCCASCRKGERMKPQRREDLSTPAEVSRRAKSDSRSSATASARNLFSLELRIRGQAEYLFEANCRGLEEAARVGEMHFVGFDGRNPWFVQDSVRRRIVILLDPFTECMRQQAERRIIPGSEVSASIVAKAVRQR